MTKHFIPLASFFAIATPLFFGCQGTAIDNPVAATPDSADTAKADIISEFPLREAIKTASECYRIFSDDSSSVYLTISASVQWPEALGDFKIKNLRDTIIAKTFADYRNDDIDKAIIACVSDAESFGLGSKIEKVTAVPDSGINEYYSSRSLQLVECTEQTVTYTSAFSEYTGGAHPLSGAQPFSFDLAADRIITFDYLFTEGASEKLKPLIIEALAENYSMSAGEIKAMLFTDPMSIKDNVYILNGQIAFHYNPYDLLPYSYGAADAYISPYQIEDYLTPAAKKLLLD